MDKTAFHQSQRMPQMVTAELGWTLMKTDVYILYSRVQLITAVTTWSILLPPVTPECLLNRRELSISYMYMFEYDLIMVKQNDGIIWW